MLNKKISFVRLFQVLILVVILCVIGMYITQGNTLYINETSVCYSIILSAILLFIFRDVRKNNNLLLFILSYWTLLYCLLRILTLNYTDYSVPLSRCEADVDSVNQMLLLYIVCTVILWLGLHHHHLNIEKKYVLHFNRKSIRNAVRLFWLALIINIAADVNAPLIGGISLILKQFVINIYFIFLFLIIYSILTWGNIDKGQKIVLIISVLAFFIYMTLGGSRSGLITVGRIVFIACLALGFRTIKSKYIIAILCILPVAVFMFMYATLMRQLDMQKASAGDKLEIVSLVIEKAEELDIKTALSPVFDRIGFLDMSTELYCQRNELSQYINVKREMMSIVDNALSPGFDVFDVPRVSNIISNSYFYGPSTLLSKSKNLELDYHSDELTLYGESVLLFGIPLCFIFLLVLGLIFKSFWRKCECYSDERCCILKGSCLIIFEKLLSSYGIDWLVLDIVCLYISYIIFKSYVLEIKGSK